MTTLPRKTAEVFDSLMCKSEDGYLQDSLEELAGYIGISRRALHKHLQRMKEAGVLVEGETFAHGGSGQWRRVRRLRSSESAPRGFPNPVTLASPACQSVPKPLFIYKENMNAKSTGELRSPYDLAFPLRGPEGTTDMDPVSELLSNTPDRRKYASSVLPDFPEIKSVEVPPMPRLTGDRGADSKMLIKAFKAACEHRYGKKPRVDKKTGFRMQHAVSALKKAGVRSPYAWAAFRLQQWQLSENASKPPKIDYVFSRTVVENHADHFKAKADSYDVLHMVVLAPSHAELLMRLERCHRALASPNAGPAGVGNDKAIVQSILPDEDYQRLTEQAERERGNMTANFNRLMAAGGWVW